MGCCWPTHYVQEKEGAFPTQVNANLSDREDRCEDNREDNRDVDREDVTMDEIIIAYQKTHPGTFQDSPTRQDSPTSQGPPIKRQNHICF